jgi:hypothetical protein
MRGGSLENSCRAFVATADDGGIDELGKLVALKNLL